MEGTTIGPTGSAEGFATEADLEEEFAKAIRDTRGLMLASLDVQGDMPMGPWGPAQETPTPPRGDDPEDADRVE